MSGKSISSRTKNLKEMSGFSKFMRKMLMDKSPELGMSKNDFFNNGYGGIVTILAGLAFMITFVYYAVTNSEYNKTAKFLVPVGGDTSGGMTCAAVPITLSSVYGMDSEGRWKSNTSFSMGESLYGLELVNSQYSSLKKYQEAMTAFHDDLKEKSSGSEDNDYAWNIIFGGSYATVAGTEGDGVSFLYLDADSRLMFDVPIYAHGLSSAAGTCIPETSDFYYDGTSFVFTTSVPYFDGFVTPACPQLDESLSLEIALGVNANGPGDFDYLSTTLSFDAASITTAIAVNYKIAPLASLTPVPSLNNLYVNAYIDSSYAPMQPVYCFNAQTYNLTQYGVSDLCMIKMGNTYAFPITAHYGVYDGEVNGFIPEACDCTSLNPQCSHYDINIGLLFLPHNMTYQIDDPESADDSEALDLIQKVFYFQIFAHAFDQTLNEYLRPLLAVSNEASYYAAKGKNLNYSVALDTLRDTFDEICPECYVLSFELYDEAHSLSGPTINKGGRVIPDMACTNVFYNKEAMDVMISGPPSKITEDYLVCTDSLTTAVSTGISNAYASAQLYSSVLLGVVLFLIMTYHDRIFRGPPINSAEEQEVILRNAIADLFEFLLNKQMSLSESEKVFLQEKLALIDITDPLTHSEGHNHLAKLASLAKSPRHYKVAATAADIEVKEVQVIELAPANVVHQQSEV